MTDGKHPYQLIEDYLFGALSQEEHIAVENRIEQDVVFAQEVELHRALQNALSDREVLELEELLIEIRAAQKKDKSSAGLVALKRYRSWLSAAAAVLLLIVAVFFLWNKQDENLVANAFEPYPFYLATRSLDNKNAQEQLNQAAQAYESEDYGAALPIFEALLSTTPDNMALQFYKAYCELELARYEEAEKSFDVILENGDSAYVQPAEWYLVQVYISQNEQLKAENMLKKIVENGGDFSGSASQLLKKF